VQLTVMVGAAVLAGTVVDQVVPHRAPSTPTSRAVTVAVDRVVTALGNDEHAVRTCPALGSADGLACVQAGDEQMATDLRRFDSAMAAIHVPSAAGAADHTVRGLACQLADDLQALASAPSAAAYTATATVRDVRPLGSRLDRAVALLEHELES
jgi:hypothetical protein